MAVMLRRIITALSPQGPDAVLCQIGKAVAKTTDAEKKAYGKNMAKCIHLCLEFCGQIQKQLPKQAAI